MDSMINKKENKDFFSQMIVVVIGAFICCALWGSAFPYIKVGYGLFQIESSDIGSKMLFAGIRFTTAGILTLIAGSIISKSVLIPKKEAMPYVFKLSLVQTVAQYVFAYVGLAYTTGVRSSILNGTNVFASIIIASLIYKQEKLSVRKIVGCLIGFSGVVLISVAGADLGTGNYILGDSLVFLSTLACGFSAVLIKRYSAHENTVTLSGSQFIIGGIILIIVGSLMGGRLNVITGRGIAVLVYLAFVSAMAYSLWGILLKHNPVSRVTIFGFMNPVCGVIISYFLLHETSSLGISSIIALVLVSLGIYLVNKGK